jgi:hypothetical protein
VPSKDTSPRHADGRARAVGRVACQSAPEGKGQESGRRHCHLHKWVRLPDPAVPDPGIPSAPAAPLPQRAPECPTLLPLGLPFPA